MSLQKGLAGHWRLDEKHYNPATKRFTDLSAYDNHGTSHNAAVFGADRMGQANRATVFERTAQDYINCGNNPILNFGTSDFSISCEIKTTSDLANLTAMAKSNGSSPRVDYGFLFDISQGKIKFATASVLGGWDIDGGYLTETINTFNDGEWHTVVLIGNRTSADVDIYVDNQKQSLQRLLSSHDFNLVGAVQNNLNMMIGDESDGGYSIDGSLAEPRIYNRVLTAAERTLLYESYRPGWVISPAP